MTVFLTIVSDIFTRRKEERQEGRKHGREGGRKKGRKNRMMKRRKGVRNKNSPGYC